ncbi:MAG: hypothetical protein MJ211_04135 [Bacteroidales bacterium]|nr:hypothetical protein [Bacteroidales bacterium]
MNLSESENPILQSYSEVFKKRWNLFNFINGRNPEKIKVVTDFLKKIVEASNFSMCLPIENLPKIIESDLIKNAMETGASKGSTIGGNEVRREATENLYGELPKDLKPSDYPKFGFLSGKDLMKDLGADIDIFWHYGSVMLTFKKENLFNRTTLTVGSSLNFNESILKSPVPVWDVFPMCIKGHATKMLPKPIPMFRGFDFFYDQIINGKVSTSAPNQLAINCDDVPGFENYELQFFGELRFSRDVESIHFVELAGNENEIINELKPKLDELNIPAQNLFGNGF